MKYVIQNLNDKHDQFIGGKGTYIKQPSSRAYHTTLEKASHYAKIETAIDVAQDLMQSWDELWDTFDGVIGTDFRKNHEVKRNTKPRLIIVKVGYTSRLLTSKTDLDKIAKVTGRATFHISSPKKRK